MYTNKLLKRDDAQRMAQTLLKVRRAQGEHTLDTVTARGMQKLPANVLALYASRPSAHRTVELARAERGVVVMVRRTTATVS